MGYPSAPLPALVVKTPVLLTFGQLVGAGGAARGHARLGMGAEGLHPGPLGAAAVGTDPAGTALMSQAEGESKVTKKAAAPPDLRRESGVRMQVTIRAESVHATTPPSVLGPAL